MCHSWVIASQPGYLGAALREEGTGSHRGLKLISGVLLALGRPVGSQTEDTPELCAGTGTESPLRRLGLGW